MSETIAPSPADVPTRRDRILDETLRILGERGYHGFGLQELAQRCGLSKPGLLHHFGSKDQLLIALLTELDARNEAEFSELFAAEFYSATDPAARRDMLRKTLRAILARALARPELLRMRAILQVEAINPDHPANLHFVARQQATLERWTRAMATICDDPYSTARQMTALLAGLEQQWLREDGRFDLLDEWDKAIERLLRPTGA